MSSRKSLVIGILIGLMVVGCIAAIDGSTDTPRYQVIPIDAPQSAYDKCWVLDNQTGTVNYLSGGPVSNTPASIVFPFEQEPVQ